MFNLNKDEEMEVLEDGEMTTVDDELAKKEAKREEKREARKAAKEAREAKRLEKEAAIEYEDDVIDVNDPVGMGDFVLSIFLTAIPVINIICLLVWIFSKNTKPSKRNWAKAKLIWVLVGLVITLILTAFAIGLLAAIA